MQTTWKSFTSLSDANKALHGNTRAAVLHVASNLFADEGVYVVTTISAHIRLEWEDGVLVLTDQRILVACSSSDALTSERLSVLRKADRGPQNEVRQLQGYGQFSRFVITTMPTVQGIQVAGPVTFNYIKDRIEKDDLPRPAATAATAAPPSTEARASFSVDDLFRQLANLRSAGVLSEAEFDQKAAELRGRTSEANG